MRISDWSSDVCSSDLASWRALNLAWWYNDHSEFFYRHIHGDKDTFHLAWRRARTPYAMPPFPIESLEGDRKSVVKGKSVSVRVDLGGRRSIKKKLDKHKQDINIIKLIIEIHSV